MQTLSSYKEGIFRSCSPCTRICNNHQWAGESYCS